MLTQLKYPDKTSYIRPIASVLLNNIHNDLDGKTDTLLSQKEIITLLKSSGCQTVVTTESVFSTTATVNTTNITNHWFKAVCTLENGKSLDVRLTAREFEPPNFRIDYGHSYCFDIPNREIDCYTQTILAVPSR